MLVTKLKSVIILLVFSLLLNKVVAQQNPLLDSISTKLEWQYKQKATNILFAHFDKNVYSPSETVWFTTYVLNPITAINNYHSFTVALVKNDDKKVFQSEVHILQNGIGRGSLVLADTIKPGAYTLMVFTNMLKNGSPDDVFIQPITVRSSSNADLKILLTPIEKVSTSDSVKVQVKVVTNSLAPIANQQVNYSIGQGSATSSGKVKTDEKGEAVIALKSSILSTEKSLLKVTVSKGFDFKETFLQIPKYNENVKVNFYPEGGSIIEGLTSVIGIETHDALGTPVSVKGSLLEDGSEITKVATGENGLGSFSIKVASGKKYTFKVDDKNYATNAEFTLPAALPNGYALQIKNGIVNDTLDVVVQGNIADQKLTVMLHNYKDIYSSVDFVLKRNSRKLRFPLTNIPRGLVTVSLLDSSGKPWSERLVFTHFDKKMKVSVVASETKIEARGIAKIKVKITDADNNPQRGYFSFACVQDSKVESKKMIDLESYFNIGAHISNGTVGLADAYANSANALESILLIKGWRKYNWQNLATVKATDTNYTLSSMKHTAAIKAEKKDPTANYKIQILKEEGIELAQGQGDILEIPARILQTFGKKLVITAVDKRNDNVPFVYENPFAVNTNHVLSNRSLVGSDFSYTNFKRQPVVKMNLEESVKQLDEVIVTSIVRCTRPSERNSCGDYVCKNGALNCPIHTTCGSPAISGQKYYMTIGGTMKSAVYTCFGGAKAAGNNVVVTKGINLEKTFYGADYQIDGKDEQIFLSTLHWNGGVITDEKGEAEIIFNTSDLTGRFKCFINGITATNKFSGSSFFTVVKTSKD